MNRTDTASSNKTRRRWHWFAQVDSLERMDLAELRKQVKMSWIRLGGFLCIYFVLIRLWFTPTTNRWHTVDAIFVTVQTALIIWGVIALVKLMAYVRQRTSN